MSEAIPFDAAHAAYLRARAELAQASAAGAGEDVWPSLFETERAAVAQLIRAPVRFREHLGTKLSLLREWTDQEAIGGAFKDDRVRALARQVSADFADWRERPTVATVTDEN